MSSTNVIYNEDEHTLKGMVEILGSEEFLREIQKHGLMLPEIVKFGSEEIEIYSLFDRCIGQVIKERLEEGQNGLFEAITWARDHIETVYYAAHVAPPTYVEEEGELIPEKPMPEVHRKKMFTLSELLEALGISEESFNEIGLHLEILPMILLIPGKAIKYYFEDDYLRLRYVLTLMSKGCSLEKGAEQALTWGSLELW